MPAMTIAWLSDDAPATPMTSARLETRPSLAPKTAGRRNAVARALVGRGRWAAVSARETEPRDLVHA